VSHCIWVTGLGLTTALGVGVEATWGPLVRGERAIRPIRLFDVSSQRVGLGAEVRDLPIPPAEAFPTPVSRTSAMALCAAEEAMSMARLASAPGARVGLVVGGTTGGMFETEQILARLHAEPSRRDALAAMLSHPLTATGDVIERRLGPFARVRTISSACSSGANALVIAATWLLAGEVDAVVAGGCDALCRLTLSGFNAITAIDPEPCRPFDRRRRGTSLGEGAGFLVLERGADAEARGASAIAELAGWALGSEAYHITNPEPGGSVVASLIERAIGRAGLSPAEIDYVNAHGTGTPANDSAEAVALARAFGREIARVPVSSSKGQLGHTLGAAGAIEAAITALVVSRRILVPTAGLDEPDPGLDLVHVPHVGRSVPRVRAALSNAFGFGGMDTVLVFREAQAPGAGSRQGSGRRGVVISGGAVFSPAGLSGATGCAALLVPGGDTSGAAIPDRYLDPMRSRRLDPSARLAVVAVGHALAEANVPPDGTGIILGSAFGGVDGSAAFMHRIFDKGPRSASPAEFPSLVPSGSVGHVSIYAGLRGPSFCAADLGVSGESAVAQAVQLVAGGECLRMLAGASEVRGGLVERVLASLFEPAARGGAPRTEMAAVVLLEDEQEARRRGARVLARVEETLEWRDWRSSGAGVLARVREPRSKASEVLLARSDAAAEALLSQTSWSSCARLVCAPAVGEGHGLGALAIVVAAARIGAGLIEEALVLGVAEGRGHALVLGRA
jgi:3-oxoacyl-[acyl-carrier-protein] synthase II